MPLSDKAEKSSMAIRFSWIKQSLEFWDIKYLLTFIKIANLGKLNIRYTYLCRYMFKENGKIIFQDWNSLVNVVCALYTALYLKYTIINSIL